MLSARLQAANNQAQVLVNLRRIDAPGRLFGEIVERPQAIKTWFRSSQPPHRYVIDAFHWALLLRIRRIANYRLMANMKNTELLKRFCELKKIGSEAPKIKLVQID